MDVLNDDDDSPYFLKITVDEVFLSQLEEPMIVSAKELLGPPNLCDSLLSNKIFQGIVKQEIEMFYSKQKNEGIPIPDPVALSISGL